MANKIPEAFIDRLLSRLNIIDVIQARISLKKSGANYMARCPFHQEKTPSFSVNANKQFYHCFGCGASGDAIQFVMDYDKLSFRETIEDLAASAGLEVPVQNSVPSGQLEKDHRQQRILDVAASFYEKMLRDHREATKVIDYLKGRGLTGQIAKQFRIGYAPPGWAVLLDTFRKNYKSEDLQEVGLVIKKAKDRYYDRFRDRVMFPIRNRKGQVIGFGGRVIDGGEPNTLIPLKQSISTNHASCMACMS